MQEAEVEERPNCLMSGPKQRGLALSTSTLNDLGAFRNPGEVDKSASRHEISMILPRRFNPLRSVLAMRDTAPRPNPGFLPDDNLDGMQPCSRCRSTLGLYQRGRSTHHFLVTSPAAFECHVPSLSVRRLSISSLLHLGFRHCPRQLTSSSSSPGRTHFALLALQLGHRISPS